MAEAVIVSAARTAVGRGKKGSLANTRPDDLAALVIKESVKRANIDPKLVEDVILGCAMPEGEQGLNFARVASLLADLPDSVSAMTVNRFCASGLQTIALGAQSIMSGMTECVVAGGAESMSMVPMSGNKPSMNMNAVDKRPGVYMNMGLTAERVADQWKISRADQDAFAADSHAKAAKAIAEGKFKEEVVPVSVRIDKLNGKGLVSSTMEFATDELVRADTTVEKLATLPAAFKLNGSVTAGNASPFSDGAAAVVMMSADKAREVGAKPLARFIAFATSGVAPEIMGIGPIEAVPKVLKVAGLRLEDIDLFELNEAFAAQALAVVRELKIPTEKLNVNGGAIALGHPLGCSGAKLSVQLIHELKRRGGRYGMVTMCIGGGQGAAGIFEILN
ncbi:MAG: thiolase family protein [Ignavibacteria bacterium]|nr:thiolase family protein [Ignavibacteria bacterium]MBL7992040.1 thiolase family protein [Candidatus Kapabacteria bacterium]